jgi:hypothetical protein
MTGARSSSASSAPTVGNVSDSFSYGEPARKRPQLPSIRFNSKVLLAVVGLLVVGVAIFGLLKFFGNAGNQVADAQATVVGQIDSAHDVEAQASLQRASIAGEALAAQGPGGYAQVTPEALKRSEPSLSFTAGPSTGPTVVSVASNGSGFAAAVLSTSGTCFSSRTTQGAGAATGTIGECTGAAALTAP